MKRVLCLALLVLLGAVPALALDPAPEDILERARSRAADETFTPLRYHTEAHVWVRDGDDELELEERSWKEKIVWSSDSTQVLDEGSELIFVREEDPESDEEEEAEGDEKEQRFVGKLDFFEAERAEDYEFEFDAFVMRGDLRLAAFEVKPQRRSRELWKGRILLDPASGAMREVEIEPAKRRFGLKRMLMEARFEDVQGMDVAMEMKTSIEVKIILLFHKKITMQRRTLDVHPVAEAP